MATNQQTTDQPTATILYIYATATMATDQQTNNRNHGNQPINQQPTATQPINRNQPINQQPTVYMQTTNRIYATATDQPTTQRVGRIA